MSPSHGLENRQPLKCPSLWPTYDTWHEVLLKYCVVGKCTSSTNKNVLKQNQWHHCSTLLSRIRLFGRCHPPSRRLTVADSCSWSHYQQSVTCRWLPETDSYHGYSWTLSNKLNWKPCVVVIDSSSYMTLYGPYRIISLPYNIWLAKHYVYWIQNLQKCIMLYRDIYIVLCCAFYLGQII